MNYWLCKTEPDTYSFEQLAKDKKTNWNDVRNYQARNNLKLMKKDDLVLIYHSGDQKSVVGVAKVAKEFYPDPEKGETKDSTPWVQVDLAFEKKLASPFPLSKIKSTASLKDLPLIKQSRLSVMPISKEHFTFFTLQGF